MINVAEIFGENVFNDTRNAGASAEEDLQRAETDDRRGKELDIATADVIAHEMKEWAIEKEPHIIRTGFSLLPGSRRKARFLYFCTDGEWKGADELFGKD